MPLVPPRFVSICLATETNEKLAVSDGLTVAIKRSTEPPLQESEASTVLYVKALKTKDLQEKSLASPVLTF